MDAKDTALKAVKSAGLVEPRKPKNVPEFPDDLTEVSSQELGMLMTQFTGYVVYTEYLHTMVSIDCKQLGERLDHTGAKVQLSEQVQKTFKNVTDRTASVKVDDEYNKGRETLRSLKGKRDLAKSLLNGYERMVTAISREISRRQVEAELQRKGV